MSQKTKIEWTEHTWNPISGCTKISEGCKNCYAEKMANRLKAMGVKGYEGGFAVTLHPEKLREPLERKKPTMYFVSMGDLFHEDVPFSFIKEVFLMMGYANQHTYQILTKRPERMREFILWFMDKIPAIEGEKRRFENWSNNIWLGVTAENQEQADKRIPILLDTPAALRFVSIEPMLGFITLRTLGASKIDALGAKTRLDWVIAGGETGAGARLSQYEWIDRVKYDCEATRVPFFFKKWGKLGRIDKTLIDGYIDGVECRAMPEVKQ